MGGGGGGRGGGGGGKGGKTYRRSLAVRTLVEGRTEPGGSLVGWPGGENYDDDIDRPAATPGGGCGAEPRAAQGPGAQARPQEDHGGQGQQPR